MGKFEACVPAQHQAQQAGKQYGACTERPWTSHTICCAHDGVFSLISHSSPLRGDGRGMVESYGQKRAREPPLDRSGRLAGEIVSSAEALGRSARTSSN